MTQPDSVRSVQQPSADQLAPCPGLGADGRQAGDSHQHLPLLPPLSQQHEAHDAAGARPERWQGWRCVRGPADKGPGSAESCTGRVKGRLKVGSHTDTSPWPMPDERNPHAEAASAHMPLCRPSHHRSGLLTMTRHCWHVCASRDRQIGCYSVAEAGAVVQ